MKSFARIALIVVVSGVLLGGGLLVVRLSTTAALPSGTAVAPVVTVTLSPSPTFTLWPTQTGTPSPTPSFTSTASATVTPTNTLSTRVLVVTVINPDVTLEVPIPTQPPVTPIMMSTQAISAPEMPIVALPTDGENADLMGWYQRDTTDGSVQPVGTWQTYTLTTRAIQRQYVYSNEDGARLVYKFTGAAVRVHYAAFYNYGMFDVVIDGQPRDHIDSYSPKAQHPHGQFPVSGVYNLTTGSHTLEIVRTGQKNAASGDSFIAIDAIDIYKTRAAPTLASTQVPATLPSPVGPKPAQRVQLLAAPPTVRPTPTQGSPVITAVDFSVAYDLNNNKVFDQLEGVQGLSVRLVRADTNQVVAAGYTNSDGFVHLEGTGNVPLRLVIPYLSKYWDIQNPSGTMKVQFIVPAVNLPGLIP